MSKKVKIIISALAVVLLLSLGATMTVMADEEPAPSTEAGCGLLARVADILEIDEEDLVNAFRQARQEMLEEQLQNREQARIRALNRAVENGYITQEQADEILGWWNQRPAGAIQEWWSNRPEDIQANVFQRARTFQARRMITDLRRFCQAMPCRPVD